MNTKPKTYFDNAAEELRDCINIFNKQTGRDLFKENLSIDALLDELKQKQGLLPYIAKFEHMPADQLAGIFTLMRMHLKKT